MLLMFRDFFPLALCLGLAACAFAQQPPSTINPDVKNIVDGISEERITAILNKLESFGTRHVNSPKDDPGRGIGAAQRWLHAEFASYSPRLQVSDQVFTIKKAGAYAYDAELANIIAVLPGATDPENSIVISAHYDTVNYAKRNAASAQERVAALVKTGMDEAEARRYLQFFPPAETAPENDAEKTAAQASAPGITDDATGIAIVLELARVMSQQAARQPFDKTLIFIAFAAEEGSHAGSKAYAASAKRAGRRIEGVLNNDIIGSTVSGNGLSASNTLRVFAQGPEDSSARAVARYIKEIGERYVPSMKVEMVFRLDRFGRGGDHMSFIDEGFPALRVTTASENFANQHSATDTAANTSVPYTVRVARVNAAVAASLALAPAAPVVTWTYQSGRRKGQQIPILSRGVSGYDAVLRWEPSRAQGLAGYAIVIRSTTSPLWEREIWVGNVTEYTLPDVSIDNVVLGVKAVDKSGNESLVSAYVEPPYQGAAAQ